MDSDSSLTELSSELSSIGSLTPIPDYPSPVSSQEPDIASQSCTVSVQIPGKHTLDGEEKPPRKKRRKVEPKPRTTEYLNLNRITSNGSLDEEQKDELELLLKVLRKRRKIVVIAGAGISVSAGSESCARPLQLWVLTAR